MTPDRTLHLLERWLLRLASLALLCLSMAAAHAQAPSAKAYYMAPQGSDRATGTTSEAPWRTFGRAFAAMAPGDELVLLDGEYSEAAGTGSIHFQGSSSAQIPSGLSPERPTTVRALNPGMVRIVGGLFIGRKTRKDSFIRVQGITFEGASSLYNTSFVTVKDCGFHGGFGIGTNDHDQGNTDNLVEDVWVWAAQQRIIAINYRAHRNVWRRMVVRGDGCDAPECIGSGSPNVGFTVYDSHDVSVQNVIVVDRILLPTAMRNAYADFAIASHTGGIYMFGRNEWLGVISLNAPDQGYYMEPDPGTTVDPTLKISNAVAWNSAGSGFNLARYATNIVVENIVAHTQRGDAVRIAPELGGLGATVRNVLVQGTGRYAINSTHRVDYASVSGSWGAGQFNQTTPANVARGNPRTDGSLKYLVRVETGSALKGKGANGADIGANIVNRYGADGTRHGEAGYNTLTRSPLWPWPNESRLKRDMCASTTRGFCAEGKRLDGVSPITLTSYVWEALGNPIPADIYRGSNTGPKRP